MNSFNATPHEARRYFTDTLVTRLMGVNHISACTLQWKGDDGKMYQ